MWWMPSSFICPSSLASWLTYTITPMKPWRRRTVKGLLVVGALFAFLSVFAIWVERQALNTSVRLIHNSTIRSAVGEYLVEQLYENVNVEKKVEEVLPKAAKELAGPAASGLRSGAGPGVDTILATG